MPAYLNFYTCPECGQEWQDAYDAIPDDDCANCGARHITPHTSIDIPNIQPCDAYVGCHPNTTKPLGRLANAELRQAKQRAHRMFDPRGRRVT